MFCLMRLLMLMALLSLAGCAGIGPGTVSRDRFDYTEAISDSWKRQMLFNMVKIRYGDAPVFMDVSSVISQYQIAGQINLGATINQQPCEQLSDPGGGRDVCGPPDHHVHPHPGR